MIKTHTVTALRIISLAGAKRRTNSPDGGEQQELNPSRTYNPA